MGSDDPIEKKESLEKTNRINFTLKVLLLLLTAYFVTIFVSDALNSKGIPKEELLLKQSRIESLQDELRSARSLNQDLLSSLNGVTFQNSDPTSFKFHDLIDGLSDESKRALGFHKLPLGSKQIMGGDKIMFSYGAGCLNPNLRDELSKFMSYEVGTECSVNEINAQKLMLMGCEPLPRRRCHPKSPTNYVEPTPLPQSLWGTPSDTSIVWDSYSCKNYSCLTDREHSPGIYDCKDCFNLKGRESVRWLSDHGFSYGLDQVLDMKPKGTIRIGIDIGGGTGTFAARMKERNVTIMTTSMNFDGPFNSFISSRGLLSMHVTLSQRFPFFENTLDIVHSMHVLSNWLPDVMLEFILYDIYRILRPGGLFWLDHFFCFGNQLNGTYGSMFDRVGFKKLRWDAGMKVDRGVEKNEWYLSALLEKPMS